MGLHVKTDRPEDWEHALQNILDSPGYKHMLASAAKSRNATLREPDSSTRSTKLRGRGTSEIESASLSSPRLDTTVKPAESRQDWGDVASTLREIHGPADAGSVVTWRKKHGHACQVVSPNKLSAQCQVFQPSSKASIAPKLPISFSEPLLGIHLKTGSIHTLNIHERSPSSPSLKFNASLPFVAGNQFGFTSQMASTSPPTPDTLGQRSGYLHHRRLSSRLASVPSPLGPSHSPDDLGSDTSGLVSIPALARSQRASFASVYGQPVLMRGPPSTTHRIATSILPEGHSADHSDPFVEYRSASSPAMPTCFAAHYRPHIPATPSRLQSYNNPLRAHAHQGPPISPNPLPATRNDLHPAPQAHQQHTPRTSTREHWIRNEACKIAALSRSVFVTRQRYQISGTQGHYRGWRAAEQALKHATDLDARVEERRNLFLPRTMRAMRVGCDDVAADGFAGCAGVGGGKRALLGYQMALMERICAEIDGRADAEGKDGFEDEAALGRWALRQQAVAEIREATGRRREFAIGDACR